VAWSSTVTPYWPKPISVPNTVLSLVPVLASSVALAEFRSCTTPLSSRMYRIPAARAKSSTDAAWFFNRSVSAKNGTFSELTVICHKGHDGHAPSAVAFLTVRPRNCRGDVPFQYELTETPSDRPAPSV